jgi:hypothetical protein
MNRNLVTNKDLTGQVLDSLRNAAVTGASSPLDLTPHDSPYFFMRIDGTQRLRDQNFGDNPYSNQRVEGWYEVNVDGTADSRALHEELKFLTGFGLAMVIPNTLRPSGAVKYAMNSLAMRELYAREGGVFIDITGDREAKARRFVNLLLTYVLPGMFWRNYYATDGLSPAIHLSTHLGQEMLEIAELWDRLVAKFGFPHA